MQAAIQHDAGELETVVLGSTAGCAAAGLAWLSSGLPTPRCLFHAITGYPCPTCGGTRCVLALLHGRVGEALAWNPMVFTGLAVLILWNVYAGAVLLGWAPRVRLSFSRLETRVLQMAFALLVVSNWAYEIHHRV